MAGVMDPVTAARMKTLHTALLSRRQPGQPGRLGQDGMSRMRRTGEK